MEQVYKISRGPEYDQYDIGYLTEDYLNIYLDYLYNSEWIKNYKERFIKYLNNVVERKKIRLDDFIRSEDVKGMAEFEAEIELLEETVAKTASYTRDEWLRSAGYEWHPIKINCIGELENPDESKESEDWL